VSEPVRIGDAMLYHFAFGHREEAEALVLKYHYSHRIPSNVQAVGTLHLDGGLFGDLGKAIAACFFSIPPTRWKEEVWELSRLVRDEEYHPLLTSLISATVGELKRRGMIDLVISFADWTHAHYGGIYQAASWQFAGKRDKRMDGLLVNGVFKPGRSCNSTWGTRSPSLLRERLPDSDIEPHFDEGKFLYFHAINRAGKKKAERLGLRSFPYVKAHNMGVT
jgi:hypothetical protein